MYLHSLRLILSTLSCSSSVAVCRCCRCCCRYCCCCRCCCCCCCCCCGCCCCCCCCCCRYCCCCDVRPHRIQPPAVGDAADVQRCVLLLLVLLVLLLLLLLLGELVGDGHQRRPIAPRPESDK